MAKRRVFSMMLAASALVPLGCALCLLPMEYDCIDGVVVPGEIALPELLGRYYRGDGLGFNQYITLNQDESFAYALKGCLGIYDTCEGSWFLLENRLLLTPTECTDEADFLPTALDVLRYRNEIILVPSEERESFLRGGPSRLSCFSNMDSGSLFETFTEE